MQLVAYGAQDVYLTGNPQITFFKVVYRRHTNFSMEAIEQTFNGTVGFGKKVSATISRNGDLITNMYLTVTVPGFAAAKYAYVDELGYSLIKNVELEVGGQQIDKQYGEWMYIWKELTVSSSKNTNLAKMLGNVSTNYTVASAVAGGASSSYTVHIPLQFYFCRNPGLALPLISLQYHEVKVIIEFRQATEVIINTNTSSPALGDTSLWVDYIYLDTDERRRFAQESHEYLIEQLQEHSQGVSATSVNLDLDFNHPVKELVFGVRRDTHIAAGTAQFFNFTSATDTLLTDNYDATGNIAGSFGAGTNMVTKAQLKLNGHERFAQRNGDYFNLVQPYYHHTCGPDVGINVYSFALRPEEHQPSGTCNFSRIDNAVLNLTLANSNASTAIVYAVNYNVLRVQSGMGGLAYSN